MNARFLAAALLPGACVAAAAQQPHPTPSAGWGAQAQPAEWTVGSDQADNPDASGLAERPDLVNGEALYRTTCGVCHGPGGMGTVLLERRRGQPALLEQRDNLPAAYVMLVARQGISNMLPIPRGELSDADLELIAGYLVAGPSAASEPQ